MGRFFCDRPYGYDKDSLVFYCKCCQFNKRMVQISHMDKIKYWEILGPEFTGVLFEETKHIYQDRTSKDGFYFKKGDHVIFDPQVSGLYTTPYFDVHCKICHIHLGYYIPILESWLIFHERLC